MKLYNNISKLNFNMSKLNKLEIFIIDTLFEKLNKNIRVNIKIDYEDYVPMFIRHRDQMALTSNHLPKPMKTS